MNLSILCSGNLGYKVLKQLVSDYKIEMVFTDSKSVDIIQFAKKRGIDLFIGNPRNGKTLPFIKKRKTSVLISVNYLYIIEKDVISIAEKIAFNIHGSLLPKYRGRTPHVWSIINNESKTGITAHIIDEGCDTGDILYQIEIPIENTDTGHDILEKYQKEYIPIIFSILNDLKNGEVKRISQDHTKATYYGKRTPEDGLINWDWQKERIFNWVRAQSYPYPGAFTYFKNKKIIIDKISYSDLGFNSNLPNGYIIAIQDKIPYVKTQNGVIKLDLIRNPEIVDIEKNNLFTNE